MESSIPPECDRDADGNVIDPISLQPIPEDRIIVVREGNGSWCMDKLSLLEQVIVYGNGLNPMTRTPLSNSVLLELAKYRWKQFYSVSVDSRTHLDYLDPVPLPSFTIDSFMRVGDLHIKVLEYLSVSIVAYRVILGETPLDSMNLDDFVSDVFADRFVYVVVVGVPVPRRFYEKLRDFVAKYEEYKHAYSPFPEVVLVEYDPSDYKWYGARTLEGDIRWDVARKTDILPTLVSVSAMSGTTAALIEAYVEGKTDEFPPSLGLFARSLVERGLEVPEIR